MKRRRTYIVHLAVIISMIFVSVITLALPLAYGGENVTVQLTEEEQTYIASRGPVRLVVDPDWYPYEKLDASGIHVGIAADLIGLISKRTGLKFEIVRTVDWKETLSVAKSGRAEAVSFLNQTEERDEWLLFTDAYYTDPNVLITREEHDYISNLAGLKDETIVLPEGTSIEERLRKDYPALKIVTVDSEDDAISMVEDKRADMTLRSLTMAAYVIKNEGHFNLKIAGEVPEYANQLRMGVTSGDRLLVGILNKGIASVSEQEIQDAINNHIAIKVVKGYDYGLFVIFLVVFAIVLAIVLYWMNHINHLNGALKASEAKYKELANELEGKNRLLEEAASVDVLTGLRNRYSFNGRVAEEIERAKRYGTPLSLIIMDMDHFKRINDTYGHDAGDDVIRKLASTLRQMVRKVDLLARWGGEEFVLLMPEVDLTDALRVAEKLRFGAESLTHINGEKVTISLGVSEWQSVDTQESWFSRTDKALYHAKRKGRNRVCESSLTEEWEMSVIEWNPGWECGNPVIDGQHKSLVERSNRLVREMIGRDMMVVPESEIESLLSEISAHFQDEEIILQQMGYKRADSHAESHHKLLERADNLLTKSREGKLLLGDVISFIVGEVIHTHLMVEDVDFFSMFDKEGK